MKMLTRIRNKYIAINTNFYNFAFQEKSFEKASAGLQCQIIIETNFKVYVEIKDSSKNSKNYGIIKSIMKELVELEHAEYDMEGLIVGAITHDKMKKIFKEKIDTIQFFNFFKRYMKHKESLEKDLGKWKKLKFLGLEEPNEDE